MSTNHLSKICLWQLPVVPHKPLEVPFDCDINMQDLVSEKDAWQGTRQGFVDASTQPLQASISFGVNTNQIFCNEDMESYVDHIQKTCTTMKMSKQ